MFDSMAYEDLETMAYEPEDWFNAAWLQRIPLTINAGQVPSTQFDFPLLINDTYPDLIGAVEAELRFVGDDSIQLEYEIEDFDSVSGLLVVWINKPTVSDGDIIRIYFDNSTAVDEQNPAAVWSDYNAVYHLNQTSFGASSTLDSTANNEDGSPRNMDATNQVDSKIDGGLNFDGIDEVVEMSGNAILDPVTGGWTVSAWILPTSDERMYIVGKQDIANPFHGWSFLFSNLSNDRKLFVPMRDTSGGIRLVRGVTEISLGVFHHVVFTYDGSGTAAGIKFYIDGIQDGTVIQIDTATGGISTGIEFNIGNVGNLNPGDDTWDGIIDEVNISNIEKTPDFIATSFNNQNNQSTFYITGIVEAIPPAIEMGYE